MLEELHHYRHSLDSEYMLWRSGQDNLSIVGTKKFECVELINQFWTYKKQSSMPVAACSNRSAQKIVATSQAGPNNYVVHYYEDTPHKEVNYAKEVLAVVPNMY